MRAASFLDGASPPFQIFSPTPSLGQHALPCNLKCAQAHTHTHTRTHTPRFLSWSSQLLASGHGLETQHHSEKEAVSAGP